MEVLVCDIGPRDGLQNEPEVLDASVRAELVRRLVAAGLPRVEAVSFVRPDLVPQMAGAEEVAAAVGPREGAVLSGLVLNERGFERLDATGIERVTARSLPPSPSGAATRTPPWRRGSSASWRCCPDPRVPSR